MVGCSCLLVLFYVVALFDQINVTVSVNYHSGFWYGGDKQPQTNYDSLDYSRCKVKVDVSTYDGPGAHLIKDPIDKSQPIYLGPTMALETFSTQFSLDISSALKIDSSRIFVTQIVKGEVSWTWEIGTSIVNFVILERNSSSELTLISVMDALTEQIQSADSDIYKGNVTRQLDPSWGLQIDGWDTSIKLGFAIKTIGGDAVLEDYYLNQGGLGLCDEQDTSAIAQYCEFERFFEDDCSSALNISYYRCQIMFIKASGLGQSLVHIRIYPERRNSGEKNVTATVQYLLQQVIDLDSKLYQGNVTLRADPTWGIAGYGGKARYSVNKYTQAYYQYSEERIRNPEITSRFTTPYQTCQLSHSCNMGFSLLDQSTNDVRSFQRLFAGGTMYETVYWNDFENFRLGTRGITWDGEIPMTQKGMTSSPKSRAADGLMRGFDFDLFAEPGLGPTIPCLFDCTNEGLVLDRTLLKGQIDDQKALIADINGNIEWMTINIENASSSPARRSRKDVVSYMTKKRGVQNHWYNNEVAELGVLESSMCSNFDYCSIDFDTSTLALTGVINGTGYLQNTSHGTEVAVFPFNNVIVGPEVKITVRGQRALLIMSKTSLILNSSIVVRPGTLGGFPGGQSVGRYAADRLSDYPRVISICDLSDVNGQSYCAVNSSSWSAAEHKDIMSHNVNGVGSGNLRMNAFNIETNARHIKEVQTIKTTAKVGQTLGGTFAVTFQPTGSNKVFRSSDNNHDITASDLAVDLTATLNVIVPGSFNPNFDRGDYVNNPSGVGAITVSRGAKDPQEGFTWTITFENAIGNIAQIGVESSLTGLGASAITTTVTDGNEIQGNFTLSFLGVESRNISYRESATGLAEILNEMSPITICHVTRIDPTDNCDDGGCTNGPYAARGLLWTVDCGTNCTQDNNCPTAPTDPTAQIEFPLNTFTADSSKLGGQGVSLVITRSTVKSSYEQTNAMLKVVKPFSFAFGGGGASYGGLGGRGYSDNPVGPVYNDRYVADLIGGSGGCSRYSDIFSINAFGGPFEGRGGAGGGVVSLAAANDIIIGNFGSIAVRGEDGVAYGEGGGGGGSGGAIRINAGASVLVEGSLDVTGGGGGYGGVINLYDGGGGGGGRLAIFGTSIVVNGKVHYNGGDCGIKKDNFDVEVVEISGYMVVGVSLPLDDDSVVRVSILLIETSLSTPAMFVETSVTNKTVTASGTTLTIVDFNVTIVVDSTNISTVVKAFEKDLLSSAGGKMEIGQVTLLDAEVESSNFVTISPERSIKFTELCGNPGHKGTYYREATMTTDMYVPKNGGGAEDTKQSLFLYNNENTVTESGSEREAPFSANGPTISFEPSNPARVTYYTKTASTKDSTKYGFLSMVSLTSRGEEGLNISNVIGVAFGSSITHGANFGSSVDETEYYKRSVSIFNSPKVDTWYKIDIKINWEVNTYTIYIDNVVVTSNNAFEGNDIDSIKLTVYRTNAFYFDEIYVGFDPTMDFSCPTTSRVGTKTKAPIQKGWSFEEVHGVGSNGYTQYKPMTRHYNFLPYKTSLPFSGNGAILDFQDIKIQNADGDYAWTQGSVPAGALVYLTGTPRSAKQALPQTATLVAEKGLWNVASDGAGEGGAGDGRQFWYTEYSYNSEFADSLNGGVAACSTGDMVTWAFNGIVLHYVNLTDDVRWMSPNETADRLHVERPKVQYNNLTNTYVMFAVMENDERTLGMGLIATAVTENGPFFPRKSFYPNGNKTKDQVVFKSDESIAVMAMTYYVSQAVIAPAPIMSPVWEFVKNTDGTINYKMNFQRAEYSKGYDNSNDIYNQRWRLEDKNYKVLCQNKLTGAIRDVPSGTYTDVGTVCQLPEEKKIVIGQGVAPVGKSVISSRFANPADPENSWWMQTSVPAVQSQKWAQNYRDGFCGMRQLDDGFFPDPETGFSSDPQLDEFEPEDRSNCSNIADNPPHPTLPDKLIGALRQMTNRRAKYTGFSTCTPDFLDLTGEVSSFEGENTRGNLIGLIFEKGQFSFANADSLGSTFKPESRLNFQTAADYLVRYRQYSRNYGDRAEATPACVNDGYCKVDFKHQLTEGNY